MEYLGFCVMWTWIRLANKKEEAILNMTPTMNQKQVRSFIGLVTKYRYMWSKRSHLIQPLTS